MEQSILNVSDGSLYKSNDMARLSCHDCSGCSSCCQDMGQSISLDPYDIYMIEKNTKSSFGDLLNGKIIELSLDNGLLLPNLRMAQKSANLQVAPSCSFLDKAGRCSIHAFRPGICRLFPLGRNYGADGLTYFVLKDGCRVSYSARGKVKISKWLGVENLKDYENFLVSWHSLKKQVASIIEEADDEAYKSSINTGLLKLFYMMPYQGDFYKEFAKRVESL